MKTLDEQIDDIEQLDALRREAWKLRQEAIEALTAEPYVPNPRPPPRGSDTTAFDEARAAWKKSERKDWLPPTNDVEKAQVLHALRIATAKEENLDSQKTSIEALITDLGAIRFEDLHGIDNAAPDQAFDDTPVLRSAYLLQALARIPRYALSQAALACFCRIVQELNHIVDPTWAAGAARGDDKSPATAFVTGECARGLLRLEMALRDTAAAAELLGKAAACDKELASRTDIWSKQEKSFRQYSLKVSLGALSHSIIEFERDAKGDLKQTPEKLLKAIETALGEIPDADTVMELPDLASTDGAAPAAPERMRKIVSGKFAETARSIAWSALEHLRKTLQVDAPADPAKLETAEERLASRLRRGAQIVRDLMSSMEQFAESAIDRQITAASPHLSVPVDGAELLFAANLFGMVTNWKRPKVRAAYELLYPLLSSNGRLLSIRPFAVGFNGPNGYRLNVATLEVTRRIANLVANLDVEPEPEFVARLMLPFEYTRVPGEGWTTDPPSRESKSVWWLTAIALDALDSVVHMLDKTINRRVLQNFQVKQPGTVDYDLDGLFYPDYGLATARKQDSIAVVLQKLREHAGQGPAAGKPLYSLILYGPPGTGKTTLVEALANSAGVPLIEITPSDILVGGAEGMERRARQVFQALSKLTHVVVLFDEFDSILLDRSKRDPEIIPTSVAEFLTPGMLPKLKTLNDASKNGRVSYVLATNFLDRIDSAVQRGGRFDERCGIYPPDVVSRTGRLFDLLRIPLATRTQEFAKGKKAERDAWQKKILGRILEVIKETGSGPMGKLAKRGWYSMLRPGEKQDGTLYGYIFDGPPKYKPVDSEAIYEAEKKKDRAQRAKKPGGKTRTPSPAEALYWDQWKHVHNWDRQFKKHPVNTNRAKIDAALGKMINKSKPVLSRKEGVKVRKRRGQN